MIILKIFLAGWVVLLVAIFLNFLAVKLDISTWYPFTESITKNGFVKALREISLISKLFLFIIYPFLLGLAGFVTLRLLK